MACRPADSDIQFISHQIDMLDVIRWIALSWAVGDAILTSTVGSAAVILAARNVPSVQPASSWSPSVQSTQTESARLARLSFNSMTL